MKKKISLPHNFFFYIFTLVIVLVPVARYKVDFIWSKILLLNVFTSIGLIYWFFRITREGRVKFPAAITLIPVLCLGLAFLLSLTQAMNIYKSELTLAYQVGNFMLFILLLANFREESWIEDIFLAMGGAALAVTVYGLLQYFHFSYLPEDQYGEEDPASFIGLSNFTAEYLLTVFPCLVGLIFRKLATKNPFSRRQIAVILVSLLAMLLFQVTSEDLNFSEVAAIFLILLVGFLPLLLGDYRLDILAIILWIAAILTYFMASKYRAGYVSIIFQIIFLPVLFFWWWRGKKFSLPWKKIGIGVAAFIVLLTVALKFSEPGKVAVRKFEQITHFNDASIRFRLSTWPICLKIWAAHPILGAGVGNIQVIFSDYQNRELENMTLEANTRVIDIHNDYIQTLVEAGLLGGLSLLALLGALVYLAVFLLRRIEEKERFWLFAGALGGIGGLLVDVIFSFGLRLPAPSMNFWVLVTVLELMALRYRPGADDRFSFRFAGFGRAVVPLILVAALVCEWLTMNYSYRSIMADFYYRQGQALKRLDRFEDALASFKRSIQLVPNEERAYFDRFICYMKLNDDEKAIKDLEQVNKLMPYFGPAHRHLGMLLARNNRDPLAMKEYETALRLMPTQKSSINPPLFFLYVRNGLFAKAVEVGEPVKSLHEDDANFLFGLGNAYVNVKRYPDAKKAYQKVLELNPGMNLARTNLAVTLLNLGEFDEALRELHLAQKADPASGPVWYNLAIAHSFRKEIPAARKALEKAISLNQSYRQMAEADPTLKTLFSP
ncbi:MAG: tetratricopeptide repeat protein [bacterium]|nr:tetratricopeptide repeat protein [bacterium]